MRKHSKRPSDDPRTLAKKTDAEVNLAVERRSRLVEVGPLASRCVAALRALEEQGALTVHAIADVIQDHLTANHQVTDGLIFDDVRTIAAAGWIEPQAGDSRRYVLTTEGRRVLGEADKGDDGEALSA